MILFKQKLKVMSACVALVFWADPVLAEQATSHSPATMWGTDTFDGVMHGHWFDHVAPALNFAYEYSLKEEKKRFGPSFVSLTPSGGITT